MFSKLTLVAALIALVIYLYGFLIAITTPEENVCQMTYMFEYPQFVKIHFKENEKFPRYNLYAYSEGRLTETVRNMKFNGAPVIFVHGNRGSYKQARSYASVALRKGIDNNWIKHLDYFSVDFNEEYSALFGGILEDQRMYLELCIKTVLGLYKHLPDPPTSVSIIAHSMGGKIAQAVLINKENAKLVNTIIALASPLDQPVLNLDYFINSFYKKSNDVWSAHRPINETEPITNTTSTCCLASNLETYSRYRSVDSKSTLLKDSLFLKNILLVTVGGGSRDFMVRTGLSQSRFSDVHSISSCMPNVWLTTDHLASTWCLQQVLVINRFLYSIVQTTQLEYRQFKNSFIEDKKIRKMKALRHFTQDVPDVNVNERSVKIVDSDGDIGEWVEDVRRIFAVTLKDGVDRLRVQMIRLNSLPNHRMLEVEAINVDYDDWIFGCAANQISTNQRFCSRGHSLTHYLQKLPSQRHERRTLSLDLHKIKEDNPEWTHVLLVLYPKKSSMQLNIDIHDASDRSIPFYVPSWYSFAEKVLVSETTRGASKYRVNIYGLDETYQALEVYLRPTCEAKKHHAVAKQCVPWTKGFDRFHFRTDESNTPFIVKVPITKPSNYNTTIYPVSIDFRLDPKCVYQIAARNSFAKTTSNIVLEFSHWLPAHIVAILLLAFRHQITLTPEKAPFKCGSITNGFLNSSAFFILSASRLLVKFLLWSKQFPSPDEFKHSMLISFVIHGSALAVLYLLTYTLWVGIAISGNVFYKFLFKLTQLPFSASMALPVIQKFPITVGTLLISMIMASCGALPLICAVLVYLVLLSKTYEEYLEEFVFKTAKLIAQKLFGKKDETNEEKEQTNHTKIAGSLTAPPEKTDKEDENQSEDDENKENENDQNEKAKEAVATTNSFEMVYNQLDPKEVEELSHNPDDPPPNETEEEKEKRLAAEKAIDEDIEKLLNELKAKQKEEDEQRLATEKASRVEYDAISDGLSSINFHLSLFLFLLVLALLNIPVALTWSQHYGFGEKILQNDPSYFPAIISIASLSIIWQMPTPRNVYGYDSISTLCYMMAIICVIYCQDSIYRLSAIISSVFIVIALQQMFMPKMPEKLDKPIETDIDIDLMDRVRQLRDDMAASELKEQANNETAQESLPN